MQDIPIQTLWGGKAKYGRCRYRIIEGAQFLNPIRPAEISRLRDIVIHLPGIDETLP